jgi:protein TonB
LSLKKSLSSKLSTAQFVVGIAAALRASARNQNDRLLWMAVGASVILHAAILPVNFIPSFTRKPADNAALEVVLVNAKSKTKPAKAEVLAQHNLDGGGNTDARKMAKTPFPVLPDQDSRDPELAATTKRMEALEQQTRKLAAQAKLMPLLPPHQTKSDNSERPDLPTSSELLQRTLDAIKLEAQIAKEQQAYAQRPKKRFVGSRAEEYRFARYVEDWRQKVERIGNMNYPEQARQMKLYGHLVLTVGINSDGTVESVQVDTPSGRKLLDTAAVHIVRMAAPYSAFPPDIRRDTDILYITRTWSFTRGDAFVSE